MSDDLIRRSDAIKAVNKAKAEGMTECPTYYLGIVPTIEPKRGEWIDEADKYNASFGIHDYRCSNCNSYADEFIGGHEWYTASKPNFCPNCGAKMKGAGDEEVDVL